MLQQKERRPILDSAHKELNEIEVSSFDVFDTVLIRCVVDPTSLFLILGRKLKERGFIRLTPTAFRASRVAAERRCRENSRNEDISLDEIYRELANALGWDATLTDGAKRIELECEAESLRPNPEGVDLVLRAQASHRRVIFVSDMYLPSAFIRDQLARFGLIRSIDGCYVSSEHLATKSTGRLFEHVLVQEQAQPANLVHVGDNMYSDVAVPRRLGIRTEPLGIACPNRYEKLMESFSDSTDGLASKFAGAARLARVSGFKYVGSEAVLWETGADVAGPILSAYVLWLLIQAQRSGLRRLYFLSRDGFLLHKIAQPLAAVLGLDIDLKYLYGSRQAWFHPIRKRLGHEHLSWLLHATSKISLRRILGRTGIEPEEVASCLEEKGFPRCEWDLNLEGADKERLGCILVDSQLANLIVSRAFQRQKSVIAYLEQEGLLKDKNWAIVDLGWNGSMQLSLASLLSSQGQDPPRGYYFRLFGRPESAGELTAYFADKSTGLGHISARPDWLTMEMFCTAGHGMTIGFEIKTNKIVPKFADCGEHLRLWGIETFQEAVISFAEHLDLKIDDQFLECDLRSMIARLSDLWWTQPEPRQANVWGHFPFEFEQVHKACQPIARPFTWLDCAQKIFQRKSDLRYESEWVEGSRVLTSHQKLLALHYGGRIRQVGALLKRFLRFGL